jgi:hypothetical protein
MACKPRRSKVWQPRELREQIMLLFTTRVCNGLRINAKNCPVEGKCEELDSLLKKGLLVRGEKHYTMGGRTTYTIVQAVDKEGKLLPPHGDYVQHIRCPCCGNRIYLMSLVGHAVDCPARY